MENIAKKIKPILSYAIKSIILTSILAGLFGLLKGSNILKIILDANYVVGSILITIGLLSFLIPVSFKMLKKPKELVDHSNIGDLMREERELKMSEGIINIFWGIFHIILIGIIEIFIKSIY